MLSQKQMVLPKIKLNNNNYYDRDTDLQYQSATLFKSYLKCEAETQAELSGEWDPEKDNKALLVGNYLHSYFESQEAHEEFLFENRWSIYKSIKANKKDIEAGVETKEFETDSGKKSVKKLSKAMYSEYGIADKMIDALAKDKGFCQLYQGEKEAIVTGEIFNVAWKGKVDCLDLDHKRFFDLKTVKDIHETYWNSELHERETFVAQRNYQLQMYVYRELIHQTFGVWCTPFIIAVSKQTYPDKQLISISDYRMQEAEELIVDKQERIENVRHGEVDPIGCGDCDYCRSTKQLDSIVDMDDLGR